MALTVVPCYLFSVTLLWLLLLAVAQPHGNITLGSSLTANANGSFWLSASEEFSFGFQKIGNGGYLLAIWFHKIREKTIVWSANRNNPVPEGSRIQLLSDGRLVLSDTWGRQIWTPNAAGGRVAYAAMLDSGNFVIALNSSVFTWQSFDEPTDTILPGQILNQGSRLVSSFSETNYSLGRFQLFFSRDGNLALYTQSYPLDSRNKDYWSTKTEGSGFQLIFNQSGSIFVRARNGSLVGSVSANLVSTGQFYQRQTLDYDGVLRHYVYPKSADSTAGRPMSWSISDFVPQNICSDVVGTVGGGPCGFNSICVLGEDQRPRCDCPTGYILRDPNDRRSGCKPNFVPQNCSEESADINNFGIFEMANVDWPGSDNEALSPVTEDWCRQHCLSDCSCPVAIFRDGNCWPKKSPFSYGRIDPSAGTKALIKFRKSSSIPTPEGGQHKKKTLSPLIITGFVLLGSSVFVILVLSASLFAKYRKLKSFQAYEALPGTNIRSFSYAQIEEATNQFKEELGRGAASRVYKALVKDGGGELVAVKKLENVVNEGDHEFKAEVNSISRTNHKNLVQLIGFCNEGKHRILVYEFMSNGSLADVLFKGSRPNWYKRMQMAIDAARGLCYLHEDCSNQIIHCDIKPQNVLLDENYSAKISDFGLAKLLKKDQTQTTTGIRGTRGYVAPEWFRNLPITVKVDVYSFGILLLEIICCRRNVELEIEEENEIVLADWAYDCYRERKLQSLVVDDEEAQHDIKRFEKFLCTAIWCIQEDPSLRPNMKKVIQMLEGSVEVSVPPDPSSYFSSI